MNRLPQRGFSLTEAIIALCVLIALGATLNFAIKLNRMPRHGRTVDKTQMLGNMRQLHLATQSMALDGTTMGDTNLNWPGNTGGTFSNWAAKVSPEYLSPQDFRKLLSAYVRVDPRGPLPKENTNGILVYQVREEDPGTVVFLTSANFTNTPAGGLPPVPGARPYEDKGFIVFRKGGDGTILLQKQAGNTNHVGGYAPLCK